MIVVYYFVGPLSLSFLQFQQMLIHRAQKRMQNSLSLNEISPHLAAISSSCISMPGHSQGDEVSQGSGKRGGGVKILGVGNIERIIHT